MLLAIAFALRWLAPSAVFGDGGQRPDARPVSIAHLSDPHLFEEPWKRAEWRAQEAENQRAFRAALAYLDDPARPGDRPDALVITGDFGIDPTWRAGRAKVAQAAVAPPLPTTPAGGTTPSTPLAGSTGATGAAGAATTGNAPAASPAAPPSSPAPTTPASPRCPPPPRFVCFDTDTSGVPPGDTAKERMAQVRTVADLLATSPVHDVYVVPGNNDIANESATPAALEDFHRFFQDVAIAAGSRVAVHDLSACYAPVAAAASCTADVGAGLRLIGFSTAAYKNPATVPARSQPWLRYSRRLRSAAAATLEAGQLADLTTLRRLVQAAADEHVHALLVTHIPDLDDPKSRDDVADLRATQPALADSLDPLAAGSWNATPAVHQTWSAIAGRPAVLGVLAGHFHSAARSDYEPPYPRGGAPHLFVSPPLAVKFQDTAALQARGLSLLRVDSSGVQRAVVWMGLGAGSTLPTTFTFRSAGATGMTIANGLGIVLVALLSALGAAWSTAARALPRLRHEMLMHQRLRPLWWASPALASLAVAAAVGLGLTLLLFCPDIEMRGSVAALYLGSFCAFLAFVLRYALRRMAVDAESGWYADLPQP